MQKKGPQKQEEQTKKRRTVCQMSTGQTKVWNSTVTLPSKCRRLELGKERYLFKSGMLLKVVKLHVWFDSS